MASTNIKQQARLKRKKRIRKRLSGTDDRPRLSVFRSARHIYAQAIDDTAGHTLAAASSVETAVREMDRFDGKVAQATHIGKLVAERLIDRGIRKVIFDRNGFLYHGRVKAVSDGAREAGLEF